MPESPSPTLVSASVLGGSVASGSTLYDLIRIVDEISTRLKTFEDNVPDEAVLTVESGGE